jgi:Flp pilus assembly CpaE family ATPase
VHSNLTEFNLAFRQIRALSNLWVLDLPNNLDRHLVTMLDATTKIVLVFEATVAGVAVCRRWLEIFHELGYDDDRVTCVLNRAGSKFRAVEEQIEAVFGGLKVLRLANAYQLHWQAATEGVPAVMLQPNHIYSKAVFKLAETLAGSIRE